jgi:DNA-binding MarR family transcriptional regulator
MTNKPGTKSVKQRSSGQPRKKVAKKADSASTPVASKENYHDFINHSYAVSEVSGYPRTVLRMIQRIAARVRANTAKIATAYGLHVNDLYVISVLERSPDYSTTAGELKAALFYTAGGMTKRLDRLEELRLIERTPHPTDRRAWVIRLTQEGLTLLGRIRDESPFKGLARDIEPTFEEAEWKQLTALLVHFDQTMDTKGYRIVGS